ncbi:MAG TPA: hypothetical protein VF881_21215 [Polyangiaceae bacterium]
MTSKSLSFWRVLLVTMAACSGQTDGGPSEDIAAKWQQYCEKESSRTTACGSMPNAGCADDAACMQSVLRAGVVDSLTSCMLRTCGTSDDACFSMAAAPYQSDATVSEYTTTCLNKRETCMQKGMSFSNDICSNAGLLRSEVVQELRTCVDGDCAAIDDCYQRVGRSHGCN